MSKKQNDVPGFVKSKKVIKEDQAITQPEDHFTVCDIEEEDTLACASVGSDNSAALFAPQSPSKLSVISSHSLSDDEESELAFSFDSNTRQGTMVSQKPRAKTTSLVHADSNLSLPKINNRSWTSASASVSKPGLWSRIKARFSGESTSVQKLQGVRDNWMRSDSTASNVSRSSRGVNPNNFNESSSYMRACIVQRMADKSERIEEEQYELSVKEKEERMKEELARKKKRELIKQEQAIRGQLPGGEHLRQRYSIMYHMNKERKHDALYVSSMLEILLKKPDFRASLSQFIAEEGMRNKNNAGEGMSTQRPSTSSNNKKNKESLADVAT